MCLVTTLLLLGVVIVSTLEIEKIEKLEGRIECLEAGGMILTQDGLCAIELK